MTFHGAAYDGNLGFLAQDDRQTISGLLDDVGGVFNGVPSNFAPSSNYGGLAVSAGAGMTSSVAAGRAAVLNSYAAVQGGLWVTRNDGTVATAAHAGNSSGNPRWDCVGVRVYDSDTGGDSSDITAPIPVQGTPSSSAAIGTATSRWVLGSANMTGAPGQSGGPALPNNFLPLYMVLVPNGASSSASFSYLDWRQFITGGMLDTGWVLAAAPGTSVTQNPYFRLWGSTVHMKGLMITTAAISSGATVGTLSQPFVPGGVTDRFITAVATPPITSATTFQITAGGGDLIKPTFNIPSGTFNFFFDGLAYEIS